MKNSIISLIVLLSCGNALALPQDWPCDNINLYNISQSASESVTFRGTNQKYEIIIENFVLNVENPISYNCGQSGCSGTIKNLKTKKTEELNFECFLNDNKDILSCGQYIADEYLFSKYNQSEYRAYLCNSYFLSIHLDECSDCFCITHNSNSSQQNKQLICNKENEKQLHCFTYYGYENYIKDATTEAYDNCIGMKVK